MLKAFIIDKLKKDKRRGRRREVQIPLYIDNWIDEDGHSRKQQKEESEEDKKYYERIDIAPE